MSAPMSPERLAAIFRRAGMTASDADAAADRLVAEVCADAPPAHVAAAGALRLAAELCAALPQDWELDPGRGDARKLLAALADQFERGPLDAWCGARRPGEEGTAPTGRRLPCMRAERHAGPHRDAGGREWPAAAAAVAEVTARTGGVARTAALVAAALAAARRLDAEHPELPLIEMRLSITSTDNVELTVQTETVPDLERWAGEFGATVTARQSTADDMVHHGASSAIAGIPLRLCCVTDTVDGGGAR